MRYYVLLITVLLSLNAWGQADTLLEKYLATHKAVIDVNPDSTLSLSPEAKEIIRTCMRGKSLFVLSENTSHDLDLYTQLRPALIPQFIPMNLKYVFIEWGRSVAYCINADLDNNYKMADPYFYDSDERRRVKNVTGGKRTFSYVGIDFERGLELNTAVNNLLYDVDINTLHKSRAFVAKIKDISSAQVPADSNAKVYYKNFHRFYIDTRQEFYEDSTALKNELGGHFNTLKYLLSNPNTQLPPPWTRPWLINHGRNPELAKNLLDG